MRFSKAKKGSCVLPPCSQVEMSFLSSTVPVQPRQSENCGPPLPGDSNFCFFWFAHFPPSLPCLLHFVHLDVEKVTEIVESGDNPCPPVPPPTPPPPLTLVQNGSRITCCLSSFWALGSKLWRFQKAAVSLLETS